MSGPLVPMPRELPADLRRYVTHLARLRPGNQVQLLRAGAETYPAMLAALERAQRQILLETYIIDDDLTGNRFAAVLRERARAGIDVRLIYDAVGGLGMSNDWISAMAADGVKVVEYHPIAPWRRRWNLSRRDHRKICVVDDEVGFTGGINISDDYASLADGGKGWHDIHCKVRGPAVLDLARLFRSTWNYAGGDPYPAPAKAEAAPPVEGGTSLVRILENTRLRRKKEIRRAYLHAINAARRTIYLENAYFLPDGGIRRALRRAVLRGVEVTVIVPKHSDVKAVEYAGLYIFRALARRGIKILQWTGVMLHSKMAVIDGVWSAVGSYNFDARSFFFNLEVVAEIVDPELGVIMEASFEKDAETTVAFDEAVWLAMPWWRRAFAWVAFRMRDWL